MAEKLSITIFLDGAAEIERQLEGIGQAGTKAFDAIGTAAEKAGGFQQLDPKDVTAKLQQFGVKGKEAIDKITTAVAAAGRLERIVDGVRQVETAFAGIGTAASAMSQRVTGAFTAIGSAAASTGGAIGRVARSLGLLGSGALVGSLGAAALAMEKAADSARILEGNLQALFRNAQAGTNFFNQIQNAAQTAGSSLQGTAKTMLDITNAFRAASQARGVRFLPSEELKQASKDAAQLFEILQQGMKLSGVRAEEASKAISALFNEISKSGQVSGDTLRKLQAQFPQLGNALAKALGAPGQSLDQLADRIDKGLAKIDFQRLTRGIKSIGPEIQTLSDAFDPTLAQRIDTISGAWDRLLVSFGKSPAGAAIKAVMDDIAKGLDEIAKKQEQVGKFTVEKPPATVTGGLLQQTFDEFKQNIEIAKQNWERLKNIVTQPVKLALTFLNLTPFGLAINTVIRLYEKLKQVIQQPIANAFQWLGDTFNAAAANFERGVEVIKSLINRLVVTPIGDAWQWIVTTFNSAVAQLQAAGQAVVAGVTQFVVTPVANAWQWIVDTFNAAVAGLSAAGQAVLTAITTFVTTPIANAWQWIVDTFNAAVAQLSGLVQTGFAAVTAAWNTIRDAGVAAWNAITTAIQSTGTAITQFVSSLAGIVWSAISGAGVAAWNAITQAINNAINALQRFLGLRGGGAAPAGAAGGQFARGGLLRGRGTGTSDSNLAWVSRGEYIVPARAVRQPGVLAFLEALRRSGGRKQKDGLPAFQGGGEIGGGGGAFAAIESMLRGLDESAKDVQGSREFIEMILWAIKQSQQALFELRRGLPGGASGGLLGGRGTGTSDSNLVRVSRGEYIVPAHAVRQPGVLAFLETLRHSGGSLRDIINDMGRFALGGLVPRTIPAFATGGLTGGGMSNVTIQFPGLAPIEGLRASEKVIDELRKSAALAQVRSGGRKPSRYS